MADGSTTARAAAAKAAAAEEPAASDQPASEPAGEAPAAPHPAEAVGRRVTSLANSPSALAADNRTVTVKLAHHLSTEEDGTPYVAAPGTQPAHQYLPGDEIAVTVDLGRMLGAAGWLLGVPSDDPDAIEKAVAAS